MSRYQNPILTIVLLGVLLLCLPAWAGDRFTDNGDGTVTDTKLGLMWANTDNQGDINWVQAEKWVRFERRETIANGNPRCAFRYYPRKE